jgi:hypothetical protein
MDTLLSAGAGYTTTMPFQPVLSICGAQWKGYISGASVEVAAAQALRRKARGFFQSNPNQFHFLFNGERTFDVRTDPTTGYNCTAIYELLPPEGPEEMHRCPFVRDFVCSK